jgi:signal transduction histidine kinase
VWFVLIIALHLRLPFGILYAEVSGLRPVALPWGEQVVIARGTPSLWRLAFDPAQLAAFGFFWYALARQYRGGNRCPALVLGLALAVLLAARVADTLLVLGLLFVQSYAKGAYTDEDEEALKLLAAHAASALENARRYGQARELAASQERTRLARELHDSVTQTLFSASLLTEALPAVWNRNAAEGALNLDQLRQLIRGALAEMRTLLFELRPSALVAADLGTLLKQLGQVLTGHTHIPVELTVEGAANVPVEVKIALYRIAQEAFNNIAKHAGAARVAVTFHAAPGALYLAVRDDGQGFESAAIPADCMGLRIMAERAAAIGADLRIDSALRVGTTVSVSWSDPSAGQG